MKTPKKLYFIFSYVFFILPPFILGLVTLYVNEETARVHIISLFVNLIVLAIIGLIASILMRTDKLHVPSKFELKYLLFGLIGNIVVYLYTFQYENMLNIANIITIYLILFVVLVVHYFLISRKISFVELWFLLPVFLLLDTLHFAATGCGFDEWPCTPRETNTIFLYTIYTLIVLVTVGYYGYKIYKYKRHDFFGLAHLPLMAFIFIYVQEFVPINEELIGTISILTAFLVVLDFIVSIVNKTYTHRKLLFYIRTVTLLIVFFIVSDERFFEGQAGRGMLPIMVVVTYASLGINILSSLLHVKEEAVPSALSHLAIIECDELLKERIKETYGDVAYNHIRLDDRSHSLVALDDNEIVGFISTYLQPLTKPLEHINEAYINIIEVHPDYRKQGIASEMIVQTEQHFKHMGISQIRGWSSDDKLEAIHLWNKLHYALSPATIHIKAKDITVDGYYFIKNL